MPHHGSSLAILGLRRSPGLEESGRLVFSGSARFGQAPRLETFFDSLTRTSREQGQGPGRLFQPLAQKTPSGEGEVQRGAHRLKVTSLSIAFVDCLIDLEQSPPPHELFALMVKSARSLDPSAMIAHALETESRLVVSRLAFFLWCARCPLERNQTWDLEHHGVQKPTYFQRRARTDQDANVQRWNLIVSPELQLIVPRN